MLTGDVARAEDDTTTATALERLLVELAAGGPPGGTDVASIRALHVGLGRAIPPIAALCARLGLELSDDRVVLAAHAAPPDALRHGLVARLVRAGTLDPAAVIGDVAWHVALSGDGHDVRLVDDLVAMSCVDGRAEPARARLAATIDALRARPGPVQPPAAVLSTLRRQVIELRGATGPDVRSEVRAWHDAADEAGRTTDAARAAYRASWNVDAEERQRLLEQVEARDDGSGWSHRAAALLAIHRDEHAAALAHDMAAVRRAVERGDAELEAAALLAVSNLTALGGDLRMAVALQSRGTTIGHRARAWRPAIVGHVNQAWLAFEGLDLSAAELAVRRLEAIADLDGVATAGDEALLLRATIGAITGDSGRSRDAITKLERAGRARGNDGAATFDEAWLGVRRVDALVAAGGDVDDAEFTQLSELVSAHGDPAMKLELALVACRRAPDGPSWRRLAARLGDGEAIGDAMALVELATEAALTGHDEVRVALVAAVEAVDGGDPGPTLAHAISHARLVARAPARLDAGLHEIAQGWHEAGFARSAALAWSSAGVAAADRGRGTEAAAAFDLAHRAFARLGAVRDVARLARARDTAAGRAAAPLPRTPAHVDVLDDLHDESVRSSLASYAARRLVADGREIPLRTARAGSAIAWVRSGVAIELQQGGDGNEHAIALRGTGRLLGAVDLLATGEVTRTRHVAWGPCEVDVVPAAALETLIAREPTIAHATARTLARRLDAPRRDDARVPLRARVARCVVHAAEELGTANAERGEGLLSRRVGRQLLADLAGASREAVSRELGALVASGVLDRHGQRLAVRDRAALEHVARG